MKITKMRMLNDKYMSKFKKISNIPIYPFGIFNDISSNRIGHNKFYACELFDLQFIIFIPQNNRLFVK